MKIRHVILLFIALLVSFGASAQKRKNHSEMVKEFKEFKIKYLAQEMGLGSDRVKEFGELYSQMEDERHKVFSGVHKLEKSVKANDKATDEDYTRLSEAMTQAKAKDAEISRRYDDRFAKILTPKQMYKMKEAEEQFRKKMHEMRRKKARRK